MFKLLKELMDDQDLSITDKIEVLKSWEVKINFVVENFISSADELRELNLKLHLIGGAILRLNEA